MPQAEKSSKILLIIGSSVFIIERIVSMLEEVKNIEKILTATDYNTALEVLYREKAGIVLLDIQMPDKKGIDFLKHIVYHFPDSKVSNLLSDYY